METKRPFLPRLREEYGYLTRGGSREIPWSRGMLPGPEATRRCRDGKKFGRQSLVCSDSVSVFRLLWNFRLREITSEQPEHLEYCWERSKTSKETRDCASPYSWKTMGKGAGEGKGPLENGIKGKSEALVNRGGLKSQKGTRFPPNLR